MINAIAKIYKVNISKSEAKKLLTTIISVMTTIGITKVSIKVIKPFMNFSIPTALLSNFLDAVTSALIIKVAGDSTSYYFSKNQSWGDDGITKSIEHIYKLNQKESLIKDFFSEIINNLENHNEMKNLQLPSLNED